MPKRKTDSAITIKVMCAISFVIYIFLLTAGYQAPTLTFVQHVLSGGQTHYDPWIGGTVLTVVLMIVQRFVAHYAHLPNAFHILTYIPSMLILTLLTDVDAEPAAKTGEMGGVSAGMFCWLIPIILAAYVFILFFARQWIPTPQRSKVSGLFSNEALFTLLTMVFMMGGVAILANGDREFHRRMKAERAFAVGDYNTVVNINNTGSTNGSADSYAPADTTMTLYRAIALSMRGSLADSLFYYRVTGSSATLTDFEGIHLYNIDFNLLRKDVTNILRSRQKNVAADYKLAGLLLSRDLDTFASELQKYYTINDSLPQHYKEALVIYQHIRSNPLTSFHNDVMEEDYQGIQDIYHKYSSKDSRRQEITHQYKHSYWVYYLYR